MVEGGLDLLFPAHELTAIGILPAIAKLPTLVRRLRETVRAIIDRPPDVLVLIDVPDFSLRVARCVRRRLPHLPIVKYVAPSVWAWRPGRARAMRPSVDLVLALLPFEPKVMRDLGGPPCVYVGHPLLGQLDALRPSPEEARAQATPPIVLALPGSRRQEIPPARRRVRRGAGARGETLPALRGGAADPAAPDGGHCGCDGTVGDQAAHRDGRARQAGGDAKRTGGHCGIGNRHARARARRRPLRLGLSRLAYRRGHRARGVSHPDGEPRQPRARRDGGAGIPAEPMHGREHRRWIVGYPVGHAGAPAPGRGVPAARRHSRNARQASERARRTGRARLAAEQGGGRCEHV